MRDVFGYIKATPDREYLLRASYLEIYNEQIHDLLASGVGAGRVPVNLQGTGFNVIMTPLREEVVTSLKAVREVMERGESNRRTASTDWNERSSRSHSVFRLVRTPLRCITYYLDLRFYFITMDRSLKAGNEFPKGLLRNQSFHRRQPLVGQG